MAVITVLLVAAATKILEQGLPAVQAFGIASSSGIYHPSKSTYTSTAGMTRRNHRLVQLESTLQLQATPQKQTNVLGEEEAPAGIGGAKFFGGTKEKEEYYDEMAELQAALQASSENVWTEEQTFDRFANRQAFTTDKVASIAQSLQSQINFILYEGAPDPNLDVEYTTKKSQWEWISPLITENKSNSNNQQQQTTPLEELRDKALLFYKEVDVAIVSGQEGASSNQIELQWEASVVWPTLWEPRVLLLGSSTLTLDGKTILSQFDKVIDNGGDLVGTITKQLTPRFWDLYHIGMSPSSELQPKVNAQEPNWFGLKYETYEIPARWMVQPTIVETGSREDANAQTIPNHAFSCIIKTMGPTRQRYVPTSPVEVQLVPKQKNGKEEVLQLEWKIPLAVEFQASPQWKLPGDDEEAVEGSEPDCQYLYQPRRKVATVEYGGEAQDKEVSDLRKQLYEQVIKDGFQPKLNENGRPIFFFLQNTVKACYTNEGLGMCVYEWRPNFVKPNEIGMELEINESNLLMN